jgi:hypothetical protein
MTSALRWGGQIVFYAAIAVTIGFLSQAPAYSRLDPDRALIKFALVHGAEKKGECRKFSAEEIAKLAPNMRRAVICPRKRLPVSVELEMDGKPLYEAELPPTGLSGDGPSRAYERFVVAPGRHRIVARLRDSDRAEGFDVVSERELELAPGQSLGIDFASAAGAFRFE